MKTREHRTPWSIWLIVLIWSLIGLAPVIQLAARAGPGARGAVSFAALVTLAWIAYQAAALVRLSRWPVVLTLGVAAWSLAARYLAHYAWRAHYPMLGVFIVLIPLGLYLACTLPHWRKMNWACSGAPIGDPKIRSRFSPRTTPQTAVIPGVAKRRPGTDA